MHPWYSNYEQLEWTFHSNSSNFQTVATNNAGPSRIISSAKPSNKASTYKPNPKSYTTPIIGIGNCSKCGELGHRSNECTTQMYANLIKEYVEDDEKGDGYDEEDIKVVEDVGDPVNSCMQRHHEEEKSPNQHNISRANGSMFGKVCKLTIDDGDCYNINSKVLDRHLVLEIETQPKLYIMEVDKSYEGIVRWPMSAHEFYWHQLDSRNLKVEAFTETIMTHGEIKVKGLRTTHPLITANYFLFRGLLFEILTVPRLAAAMGGSDHEKKDGREVPTDGDDDSDHGVKHTSDREASSYATEEDEEFVQMGPKCKTQEPDVKVLSLTIISAGRPYIVLQIPENGNPEGLRFTLKQGSKYRLRLAIKEFQAAIPKQTARKHPVVTIGGFLPGKKPGEKLEVVGPDSERLFPTLFCHVSSTLLVQLPVQQVEYQIEEEP
nr:rho GDP-dissociation inhibitor 1-like [Ipomoea trifida]